MDEVIRQFDDALARSKSRLGQKAPTLSIDGTDYICHRVIRVSLVRADATAMSTGRNALIVGDAVVTGYFVASHGTLESAIAVGGDHRTEKSKRRDAHLAGTFVLQRDGSGQTYVTPAPLPSPCDEKETIRSNDMSLVPSDALVVTPTGMVEVAAVTLGDVLTGANGLPSSVTGFRTKEVSENFVALQAWGIGTCHVSMGSRVPAFRPPTDKEAIMSGETLPISARSFRCMDAAEIRQGDWVIVPGTRAAVAERKPEMPPTYDIANYIDKAVSRYSIGDRNIRWERKKISRGGQTADGTHVMTLAEVSDRLGISRDEIARVMSSVTSSDTKPLTERERWALSAMGSYVRSSCGLTLDAWYRTVSGMDIVLIPRYVTLDSDLAYLIGFYLADGSCVHGTLSFALNKNDTVYMGKLRKAYANLFPGIPGVLHESRGNGCSLGFAATPITNMFKSIVPETLYEKRIPSMMFAMSRDIRVALLSGLMDGDGSYRDRVRYVGASRELVVGVRKLAFDLGWLGDISHRQTRRTPDSPISDAYCCSIPNGGLALELAGLASKQSERERMFKLLPDGYVAARIRSVQRYHYEGDAYAIETEGNRGIVTTSAIVMQP